MAEGPLVGAVHAALVEHVAQAPAVVGDALAEDEVGVEAALRDAALLHVLVAEDLALGERVVEGGQAECGDVGVGGREFGGCARRSMSSEPSSSSGMKPIAIENAAIGCSVRLVG